jgi:hypothetical protein
MLQRILGGHPDIHTVSEPWLLLHPMCALQKEGIWTEYDARIAGTARQEFLASLARGEEAYFEGMRRMYGYLYKQVLAGSDKRYFLDKTPRYYQIIPQVQRLFPEARFIILLRNPLAVLCSILRTWIKGRWPLLYRYKHDLLSAPMLLLEGIEKLDESCVVVHYENLVKDAESEVRGLCAKLGIQFTPDVLTYGKQDVSPWQRGDKIGVHQHNSPDVQNIEKWIQDIEHPQVWRLVKDYLLFLGHNTVNEMGYRYDELWNTLLVSRPSAIRLAFTWPLSLSINALNCSERGYAIESYIDNLLVRVGQVSASLKRNGVRITLSKMVREVRK